MKNIAIQIFTWLVLSLTLAVVTSQAQSYRQYKAQIPFQFNIGNKTYEAGEYFFKIKDALNQMAVLEIRKARNENIRLMAVFQNGSRSVDKSQILFNRSENGYSLTKMISPEFGFTIAKSKTKTRMTKKPGVKPGTVNPDIKPGIVAILLVS